MTATRKKTTRKKAASKKTASKKAASSKKVAESHTLVLEKRTMIGKIDDFRGTLASQLDTPELFVDASAVEAVDTASLQLLTAFVARRASKDMGVAWKGLSDEFRERVELLGLSDALSVTGSEAAAG